MSHRQEIVNRICEGLRVALLPDAPDEHPGSLTTQASPGDPDRFQEALEALSGTVHRATGPGDAALQVVNIVRSLETDTVLAWSEAAIGLPGLKDALEGAGIRWHEAEPGVHASQIHRDFSVGITGADAGLADVGALVVTSGPGRARQVSLVPPVHVALLPIERLYADMPSFWAAHPDAARDTSNLVFIAGPSRTADIELTLALGVHGPKELHVVLVE